MKNGKNIITGCLFLLQLLSFELEILPSQHVSVTSLIFYTADCNLCKDLCNFWHYKAMIQLLDGSRVLVRLSVSCFGTLFPENRYLFILLVNIFNKTPNMDEIQFCWQTSNSFERRLLEIKTLLQNLTTFGKMSSHLTVALARSVKHSCAWTSIGGFQWAANVYKNQGKTFSMWTWLGVSTVVSLLPTQDLQLRECLF